MKTNETIRIAPVENGFVVDLAPPPNFIGSRGNRQPDDYVANSVRVFETIEALTAWINEHFTYRPDAKVPPADQWSEAEIKDLAAKGPGAPLVLNTLPAHDPSYDEAGGQRGWVDAAAAVCTIATKSMYDVKSGNRAPIGSFYGRHITGVSWGRDGIGEKCLLVTLGV